MVIFHCYVSSPEGMPHGFPMGFPIGSLVAGPTGGCTVSSRKYGRGFKPVIPQLDTIVTGWWYTYPSEKYDFVSWDDSFRICPLYMEKYKMLCLEPPTRSSRIGLDHQLKDSCSATTVPAILEFWSCHHPLWGCPK